MKSVSRMPMAAFIVWASIAVMTESQFPPVDPPSPGEQCPTLHAAAHDNHGHTMWCSHMVDGPDYPVWLYTGVY
jgi:hypothetical protein